MRRPQVTPSLVISLLALFVALSSGAYAATGGNFILGQANTANQSTTLTGSPATGPALAVSNTTASQPAASFTVQGKKAPFTVSSTGKVAKLNADMLDGLDSTGFLAAGGKAADSNLLDGLDSTQLQRRVTGTCAAGSAITSIGVAGTTSCASFRHTSGASGASTGPLPCCGDIGQFDSDGGPLLVAFNASAFKSSPGPAGLVLISCTTTPCTAGNGAFLAEASLYVNEVDSHRALVSGVYFFPNYQAGTHYLNVLPAVGTDTLTDLNDRVTWSIVQL